MIATSASLQKIPEIQASFAVKNGSSKNYSLYPEAAGKINFL